MVFGQGVLGQLAVKILRPREEDGELESIFRRELQIVGKLSHPGIIPVYNCGVFEKSPFLVMRYMENGDLEHHMKSGTLPPVPQLLNNLADIVCALEFIHRNGVVHHDVKPSNIMLTSDNDAKLGDFDLADERPDGDLNTQCTGWGSPGYVSPERLYGGGEDFRGDIFSLGATVYELLSGKLPFGVHGEPAELYQRRQEPFDSLTKQMENRVDQALSDLVDRMLSFDPEQRPQYPEIIRELRSASRRLAAPKQLHIGPIE